MRNSEELANGAAWMMRMMFLCVYDQKVAGLVLKVSSLLIAISISTSLFLGGGTLSDAQGLLPEVLRGPCRDELDLACKSPCLALEHLPIRHMFP